MGAPIMALVNNKGSERDEILHKTSEEFYIYIVVKPQEENS